MRIFLCLTFALLICMIGCKTTIKKYDPATGALISEEEVYDVQTTMLFVNSMLSTADRLNELYAKIDAAKTQKEKDELAAEAAKEQQRLQMAAAMANSLLPALASNPELQGRIEQIIDTYTKPKVAASVAKDVVKDATTTP